MLYVRRDLEKTFEKVRESYGMIVIVGARQAGKTTLLKRKLEEHGGTYVSLDDPDARELFNEDIKKFEKQWVQGNKITGIDEVQYGEDAGIKLKYLVDKGYKLWVTSSSEIILGRDVLSYLVGRTSILRLFPFSLNEFLRAGDIKVLTGKIKTRAVWEHLNWGGYPKVVLTDDSEMKKILLRDLIDTMLLKDVSKNFSIEDLGTLENLVRYLAVNVGGIISYENITSMLGISFQTLKKYLNALEKSYVVTRVLPFYTNRSKELTKRPKVYFIDAGLRNVVANEISTEVKGDIFENYVLTELLKLGFTPKYWRTKSKAEVDFVVERESSVVPIEVKITATKTPKSLKSFIRSYKPKEALVVFHKGKPKELKVDGCKVMFTDVLGLEEFFGVKLDS
ncbi:MAG: ATP-binding protein [Candidatus Diapherotrites archaeon]|nr:ATP-binding protein [Candidatus Diapherotrites archaeon]